MVGTNDELAINYENEMLQEYENAILQGREVLNSAMTSIEKHPAVNEVLTEQLKDTVKGNNVIGLYNIQSHLGGESKVALAYDTQDKELKVAIEGNQINQLELYTRISNELNKSETVINVERSDLDTIVESYKK